MAIDVSGLTAYIEENKADLITKAITGSKIMDYVDIRQGIKGTEKIPIIESTAPAQAGAACGYTSSGSTTITQTQITTTSIKVEESLCLKDLEGYFTQKWLKPGAKPDNVAIFADIMNRKIANIARKVGQMLVKGDTDYTNDTWLKRMNGFISTVDSASDEIVATAQASISSSTVRGIFEDIIFDRIPNEIIDQGVIVGCGYNVFRTLQNKLMVDNLFHYPAPGSDFDAMSMVYPGTKIKVVGMPDFSYDGVDGGGVIPTAVQNRILAWEPKNFIVGMDTESDLKDFEVWYSQDNEQLRMRFRVRIGIGIHFTDQVVSYANS